MVLKKKHSKQLKKIRQKKEADKSRNEPEIDFDTSAYVVYNRLEMTYPCLSFDIVRDDLGNEEDRVKKFPLSLYMVAGAQTPAHVENNYIYVMKVDNIKPLKQENEEVDDEQSDEDEAEDPSDLPKLTSVRVGHKGCVNRLRVNRVNGKAMTATWSDKGKVHIYDLTTPIQAVSDQRSINTYTAQKIEPKPIYTFGGHFVEGYALDWSPHRLGGLATGDCKKNIHIWSMRDQADWIVDQQPLIGHENSVEDIKWSPDEADILASCSVDKSIRFWDLRQPVVSRCATKITDAHKSDVNVIDWNKISKNLLVSGGDDGVVKVWDLRYISKNTDERFSPVAQFDHHKKPITSVEWDPNDDTVLAVCSEDDRLTLWDLAVEKDDEQEAVDEMETDTREEDAQRSSSSSSEEESEEDDNDGDANEEDKPEAEDGVEYGDLNFKTIPEQMLFLHQGQAEIKELHWHPQLKGIIVSTALNGINVFKTISA